MFAAYTAFLFNTQKGRDLLLLLLCAAAHETGHIAALMRFGVKNVTVELHPGGAALKNAGLEMLPYSRAAVAALAGPAVNAVSFAVFFLLYRLLHVEVFSELYKINLVLGAVNLLPLSFLDGGTALRSVISLVKKDGAPPDMAAVDLITLIIMSFLCAAAVLSGRQAYYAIAFTGYCIVYFLMVKY
jgi:Zn-dependent protease